MVNDVAVPGHVFQDTEFSVAFTIEVTNTLQTDVMSMSGRPVLAPFIALSHDDTFDRINDIMTTDLTIGEGN